MIINLQDKKNRLTKVRNLQLRIRAAPLYIIAVWYMKRSEFYGINFSGETHDAMAKAIARGGATMPAINPERISFHIVSRDIPCFTVKIIWV